MHKKLMEIPTPRHQRPQQRRQVAQAIGDQVAHLAAAPTLGLDDDDLDQLFVTAVTL